MMKSTFTKRISLIILLIAIAIAGSGCGKNQATTNENDTLIILQGVDATTLDPGMHSEGPTANIEKQLFDTFLDQDTEMKIIPLVAKSWKMLNDTTWQFELRDDIYFHDGKQLTTKDVKFSIERILDPNNKSSKIGDYKAVKAIETNGDYNLTIKTTEPYPLLLTRLASLRIVPEHYIKEVGNQQFSLKPIGSGPYKLKEWIKDEYVLFTANENYWQGKPKIQNIKFKPVPEAASRIMALQKGEADIIVNVPPHQVEQINNSEKASVEQVDSVRFIMLPITTRNEKMKDLKVRQALNYAIDVNSIIDNIFSGNAKPSSQPVGSYDLGFNRDLKPYGYNPEKAKQLLKEAGYEQGLKITMGAPTGRYIMDKEVAEAIKNQLEQVGFEVELSFPEWGNYVAELFAGELKYDIWLIGWGSSTFDAGNTLNFWLNSSLKTCYYQTDKQTNDELNQLIKQALTEINEQDRINIYQQITNKIYNDATFVNLYQQVDLYGVSNRINWQPRPDESIRVYEASWKNIQ
ncbi:ABC transporter substrate-binding protein [Clostridium sp. 'deep sea']|uniref:ABC transporter substrate-binding protein n=1 Tax=Clostridium sp. 'deep sea' TaxID=2779445 RepID=UPI0018967405|nr:ABC transporter substrate-binding protein [Clostridium sp. 'deep sea']QOR34050.1 ABC transporter substrate-binding protein [Clostridium sp. 'deep sea']